MAGQSVQARVCFAIALAMRELHAALEAQLSKTLIEVGRTSQCEGVSKTRDVKVNIVTEDKLAAFEHLQDLLSIGPFEKRLIGQRSIGHTMHSAGHLLHFVARPELTIVDGRTAGGSDLDYRDLDTLRDFLGAQMYCLSIDCIDRGPLGLLGLLGLQLHQFIIGLQFCCLRLCGQTLIEAPIERGMSQPEMPPQAIFGGIGTAATSARTGKSVSSIRGLRLLARTR